MADDVFEARLGELLRARAATASRPFDATAVARTAVLAAPRGVSLVPVRFKPARSWLVLAAAVALLAAALAIGSAMHPRSPILAIGRNEGLWFDAQDGSPARQIRSDGPYFVPRWSADGRYVAVSALTPRDDNDLLVLDATGHVVSDRTGVFVYAWSPAGNELATLGPADDQLVILDVDGRVASTLLAPAAARTIRSFSWSPEGTSLLVAADTGNEGDEATLWIIPRVGLPRQFSAERPMAWAAWSPDGTFIAATWTRCPAESCERQIRWYDAVQGGRRGEVQHLQSPANVLWSPDGGRLAFDDVIDGQREIFAFDPATLDLVRLATDPAADTLVGWSPDGRSVIDMRAGGDTPYEFWLIDIATGASVRLASDAYGVGIQPLPGQAARVPPPSPASGTPIYSE